MTPDQVRSLALALPHAVEQPHFDLSSFRVGGKIFATLPADQLTLRVFVDEPQRESALALYPDIVDKLLWGSKVCGLSIRLAAARPAMMKALLRQAWAAKAPKRLLAELPPQ